VPSYALQPLCNLKTPWVERSRSGKTQGATRRGPKCAHVGGVVRLVAGDKMRQVVQQPTTAAKATEQRPTWRCAAKQPMRHRTKQRPMRCCLTLGQTHRYECFGSKGPPPAGRNCPAAACRGVGLSWARPRQGGGAPSRAPAPRGAILGAARRRVGRSDVALSGRAVGQPHELENVRLALHAPPRAPARRPPVAAAAGAAGRDLVRDEQPPGGPGRGEGRGRVRVC
jgi:hypothetical protein